MSILVWPSYFGAWCVWFAMSSFFTASPALHLVSACCLLALKQCSISFIKYFFTFNLDLKTLSLSFLKKIIWPAILFLSSCMSVLHQLNVLSIFIYRHQPGSAALSRLKGNRGRVWRCLCPQHQPWLLTTSVRLRQRTGIYSDTHIDIHRRFDRVLIKTHKLILCAFVYHNPSLHLVLNLVFLSPSVCLSAWLDHNVGSSQWEASKNYQWRPPSRDGYTACEGTHTHTRTCTRCGAWI